MKRRAFINQKNNCFHQEIPDQENPWKDTLDLFNLFEFSGCWNILLIFWLLKMRISSHSSKEYLSPGNLKSIYLSRVLGAIMTTRVPSPGFELMTS